jgi:transcription-repair coupling factor (superfamily II helicase)
VGGQPLRDQAVVQWASDLIRAVMQDGVGDAARVSASAVASS